MRQRKREDRSPGRILVSGLFRGMCSWREGVMSRILIIGAGGVGRVVAHKCARLPAVFSDVWLASRTLSKCDRIAAEIDARQISTAQVDADNVPELVALIRRVDPRIVINVALPYQDLSIMDACLETGVDYLDTANYEPRSWPNSNINGSGPIGSGSPRRVSWRCSARASIRV